MYRTLNKTNSGFGVRELQERCEVFKSNLLHTCLSLNRKRVKKSFENTCLFQNYRQTRFSLSEKL